MHTYIYTYICTHICMHTLTCTHWGVGVHMNTSRCPQISEALNLLVLELQDIVSHQTWVLRTKIGSLREQQALLST